MAVERRGLFPSSISLGARDSEKIILTLYRNSSFISIKNTVFRDLKIQGSTN